jgi:hypothetical protein
VPRKVDYASRFEFLRLAAFAIVRDRGVWALSRRALAHELGTSRNRVDDLLRADAHLPSLAAEQVVSLRRSGRFGLGTGGAEEAAAKLMTSLLPDSPERIDEELVWLRLRIELAATRSPGQDPDGPLWAQFQVAARGYVYAPRPSVSEACPDADEDHDEDTRESTRWEDLAAERDRHVVSTLTRAREPFRRVAGGEVAGGERDEEIPRLHALIDGLTLAVCTGRLTPDEAIAVVRAEIRGWTQVSVDEGAAG